MIDVIFMTNCNIPKIIHQIAPSNKMLWHPLWHKCQQSWLKRFKDFEYKLWNDENEIDNFVLTNYSQFANFYNNFPVQIMKIDFARLCILHHYGGIYGDMDYFVYSNFYDLLNKDVGLVENLTQEYTSAIAENCLMYSVPNNNFIWECIVYTKICFIQFRNQFKSNTNNWRTTKNDFIVNNTTGSGMLSAAYEQLKTVLDIQLLPTEIFNNRPGSYDSSFVGKHVHTSIWGNEYANCNKNKFLINNNGSMWSINSSELENNLIDSENFNFYWDYTDGKYLKLNNLEHIKQLVKNDS